MDVDWELLGSAIALVLVIEGLFPFMSPKSWKGMFARLLLLSDGQLRFFGLCSMALGLLLFWVVS